MFLGQHAPVTRTADLDGNEHHEIPGIRERHHRVRVLVVPTGHGQRQVAAVGLEGDGADNTGAVRLG